MKRIIYLLLFVLVFAINSNAQVAIGTDAAPVEGAILELKSSNLGFLPTRVELTQLSRPEPLPAHVEGMVVFNTKVSETDTLQAGLYYNTGTRWMRLSVASPTTPVDASTWFYMPSIVFDVSVIGTGFTVDLYAEFIKQFKTPGPAVKSSADAPDLLFVTPKATDFYYYILDYDKDVFDNIVVTTDGKMTYDVKDKATDATFLNIVFVEK